MTKMRMVANLKNGNRIDGRWVNEALAMESMNVVGKVKIRDEGATALELLRSDWEDLLSGLGSLNSLHFWKDDSTKVFIRTEEMISVEIETA